MTDQSKKMRLDDLIAQNNVKFPNVKHVTAEHVLSLDQETLVFVDCRSAEEIAVSTLPNALPSSSFDASKAAASTVVCYCTIGFRSSIFAEKITSECNAVNLSGSLLAWSHVGGPFQDAEGNDTKKLHVYGAEWDLCPATYKTIMFEGREGFFEALRTVFNFVLHRIKNKFP